MGGFTSNVGVIDTPTDRIENTIVFPIEATPVWMSSVQRANVCTCL